MTLLDNLTLRKFCRVFKHCFLVIASSLSADDYRLTLTEWWEHLPDSKPVNKCETHKGLPLLRGQTAALSSGSIMQLEGLKGEVFRIGSNTHFTLLHDRQFRLAVGSIVVYIPPSSVLIQGPLWILAPWRGYFCSPSNCKPRHEDYMSFSSTQWSSLVVLMFLSPPLFICPSQCAAVCAIVNH